MTDHNTAATAADPVSYPGFLIEDRPHWRVIHCQHCPKLKFMPRADANDLRTTQLVLAHGHGTTGTPWHITTDASVHAFFLAGVTQEVHFAPWGTYERSDVFEAAADLIAALQSQLPRTASDDVDQLDRLDPTEVEPAPQITLAQLVALYELSFFAAQAATGPDSERTFDDQLVATIGNGLIGAVGMSWPQGELCLVHLVDQLAGGELLEALPGNAVGRLIFDDEDPPKCPCPADHAAQLEPAAVTA